MSTFTDRMNQPNVKALKEQRADLATQSQKDPFNGDPAEWDGDVQHRWDELTKQIEELTRQIDVYEARQKNGQALAPSQRSEPSFVPGPQQRDHQPQYNNRSLVDIDGNIIPTLTRDSAPQAPASFDFGRYACAKVVGPSILSPEEQAEWRALDSTSDNVPDLWSDQFWDHLRAQLVTMAAGSQQISMPAQTLKFHVIEGDPTSEWLAELAASTPSDPTIVGKDLNAKRLQTTSTVSLEYNQWALNGPMIVSNTASGEAAVQIDKACLVGSGTGAEPLGIWGTGGILTHTTAAGGLKWVDLSTSLQLLLTNNNTQDLSRYSLVMNPIDAENLDQEQGTSNDHWRGPTPMGEPVRKLVTTSMPAGQAIVGDFSNLVVGAAAMQMRWFESGTDGTINAITQAARIFRLLTWVDCLVMRPKSFVAVTITA